MRDNEINARNNQSNQCMQQPIKSMHATARLKSLTLVRQGHTVRSESN